MEYSLYVSVGALIFAALIGGYLYLERPFGLASEEFLKEKMARKVKEAEDVEAELNDKISERIAKETKAVTKNTPLLTQAVTNMDLIASANKLREAKLITEDHYKKLVDGIMS